jgi:hypothetical protein
VLGDGACHVRRAGDGVRARALPQPRTVLTTLFVRLIFLSLSLCVRVCGDDDCCYTAASGAGARVHRRAARYSCSLYKIYNHIIVVRWIDWWSHASRRAARWLRFPRSAPV